MVKCFAALADTPWLIIFLLQSSWEARPLFMMTGTSLTNVRLANQAISPKSLPSQVFCVLDDCDHGDDSNDRAIAHEYDVIVLLNECARQ